MSVLPKIEEFLFGPATAPYQVEGGLDELSDYGMYAKVASSPFKEPARNGCDHFNLYEQDIRLIAELGFNAYRFGVEWARVQPELGVTDENARDHYRRMAEACRRYGLAPVVTLHHFSSPRWLITAGDGSPAKLPSCS